MPRPIVVFGATSLVGSDFVAACARTGRSVTAVGRRDPRSIGLVTERFEPARLEDERELGALLRRRSGDAAWINFAARTDVDGCEVERATAAEPTARTGRPDSAWVLNAELPGWLSELSAETSVPFLQISTDFVFDGERGPYAEGDRPSPWGPSVSWYGFTKGVGEERVRAKNPGAAVVRISYPYRAEFPPKEDFARGLLRRARAGTLYPLYTDQQFTPTWVPDVTRFLSLWADDPRPGTFHVASPDLTTPMEFGKELIRLFGLDGRPLAGARMADGPRRPGTAPRPLRGGLSIRRAIEMGAPPCGFREGLRRMREELQDPASP
jgi:dTDP-4-dehydrorhamnose reductase